MDDREELALRLLSLAGGIMEDASAIALIGADGMSLNQRAASVTGGAADAQALSAAAHVLLQRC